MQFSENAKNKSAGRTTNEEDDKQNNFPITYT